MVDGVGWAVGEGGEEGLCGGEGGAEYEGVDVLGEGCEFSLLGMGEGGDGGVPCIAARRARARRCS